MTNQEIDTMQQRMNEKAEEVAVAFENLRAARPELSATQYTDTIKMIAEKRLKRLEGLTKCLVRKGGYDSKLKAYFHRFGEDDDVMDDGSPIQSTYAIVEYERDGQLEMVHPNNVQFWEW